jgi:hypothetical protein
MRGFRSAALVLTAVTVPLLGGIATPHAAVAADAEATAGPNAFAKLHAVSASSTTDAWAVGFRQAAGGDTLGLTRHWDGTSWKTVPSVHPGEDSFLWGVTDLSPTDAWAVGETIGEATLLPFAEHWDGIEWSLVRMRNRPGIGKLNAVSASGPDDVWMVGTGYANPLETPQRFIEHWDGTRIRRVKPGRLDRARSTELTSVTALAPNDVWAVGSHGRHGQTYLPLVEHYDGTSWSVVADDPGIGHNVSLNGVDAASADDAWIVGWHVREGDPTSSAWAEHWDGTQWTQSPAVTPGYGSYFTGVSVVSSDDVWAVGTWARALPQRTDRPLIEHWDGTAWSVVTGPSGVHTAVNIESVSMDSASDGLAVGEKTKSAQTTPYTAHWNGTVWSR